MKTRQIEITDDSALMTREQAIVGFARDFYRGDRLPYHRHRRAQLVYANRGTMTVRTRSASYLVPPHRAVWMPGGVDHAIEARTAFSMQSLYFNPETVSGLSKSVGVLQVSPLLRESIASVIDVGNDYEADGPVARIMAVIVDQIREQPLVDVLMLPMPEDPRLLVITDTLIQNPADSRDLPGWAKQVGASPRTLNRLFPSQTGLTFREWRQQRRLMRALELLDQRVRITDISLELGYESTSAFIAMFKRYLGTTPGRYLDVD